MALVEPGYNSPSQVRKGDLTFDGTPPTGNAATGFVQRPAIPPVPDGLPAVPGRGLVDRVGAHRGGVQDGGEPASEAERDALGGGDGADAVCHLRALYEGKPGQWDAFWERAIN